MLYHLLKHHCCNSAVEISPSYCKLTAVDVEDNGIITRRSEFKRFDSSEALNPFSFNDFSLSNIIAKGAFDLLKPVYVPDVNPLNVVNHVEQSLNAITDVAKKAES